MQGMFPTSWIEVKSDIASAEMVSTVSFEVISKLQRDRQHHSHAVTGMHICTNVLCKQRFHWISVISRNKFPNSVYQSFISLPMHESLGTKVYLKPAVFSTFSFVYTYPIFILNVDIRRFAKKGFHGVLMTFSSCNM